MIWGLAGLVLVFSGRPDPTGYIGAAFLILAPVVGVVAIARTRTRVTIVVGVLATVPLALFAVVLWMLSNDTS